MTTSNDPKANPCDARFPYHANHHNSTTAASRVSLHFGDSLELITLLHVWGEASGRGAPAPTRHKKQFSATGLFATWAGPTLTRDRDNKYVDKEFADSAWISRHFSLPHGFGPFSAMRRSFPTSPDVLETYGAPPEVRLFGSAMSRNLLCVPHQNVPKCPEMSRNQISGHYGTFSGFLRNLTHQFFCGALRLSRRTHLKTL